MITILFKKRQSEIEILTKKLTELDSKIDEVKESINNKSVFDGIVVSNNSNEDIAKSICDGIASKLVKNSKHGGEVIVHDSGNKSPWTYQQKEDIRKTITKTHELLSKLESEVSDNRSNLTKEIDDIEHNIQVNLNLIKDNQIKLHNQNQIAIKKLEVVQKENAKRLDIKFNSLITDLKESKHKMTIDSKENVDDVIKELSKFYDVVMKTLSDKQLEEVMKNVTKK